MPFPHTVGIVTLIVGALTAAEQGVKSIFPSSQIFGNIMQDMAAFRVEQKLLRKYLDKLGYADVLIPGTYLSQVPLYPSPTDLGGAFAYVSYAAIVAALAGVEAVGSRTVDEAVGIATKETHLESYRAANWMLNVVRGQKIHFQNEQIALEEKIFEIEVTAMVDKILELGDGDIVQGCIRGVDLGMVDSPMSINFNAKSKVLGIRDNTGACRYLDFGNLPVPTEAKEFHRERVAEREKAERRKMDYYVAVEDFWALSKGKIKGAPAV
jgi:methylaspartate mutase epsilon subunit